MLTLQSKNTGLSFFAAPCGGVKPVEMTVTHLLRDEATEKKYFVFTPKQPSGHYFAREYRGAFSDRQFFAIKSKDILDEILQALRNDGLDIRALDRYLAQDQKND